MSKFAPITASFLARKGEAAPSLAPKRVLDWTRGLRAPAFPRQQDAWLSSTEAYPEAARGHTYNSRDEACNPDSGKSRRIVVTITASEFERLGIAAAKKDMTRHELVHAAIRSYFNLMSQECGGACLCLSGENNVACGSDCRETGS